MIDASTTVRFTNEYGKVILQLVLTDDEWVIEHGNYYEEGTVVTLEDLIILKEDLEKWIEQKKKEGL